MERKSVRFQAEEMIKEIDRLKREEEAKRLDEERLIAEKKEAEEKAEVEEAKVKKEEEEKKQMEKAKKPIPRPPPLPSCWPPQVVNGKNVGGDGAPGAFGMPSDGGGRGGLLSALMGGRGGGGRGGPLAILRRKSGTMLKPPVPKLKQLHWDTLESTEGTLWAEDSSTLGMVLICIRTTLLIFRPSPMMHSPTSRKSSLLHKKRILLQRRLKICRELLACQEEKINP